MRILVLDDSDRRLISFKYKLVGATLICTWTTKDCIENLKNNGPWDFVFLDHDLDGKTYVPSGLGTGYEVAEWISKNPDKKPTNIIFHTLNDIAAPKMLKLLPGSKWFPGIFYADIKVSNLDHLEDVFFAVSHELLVKCQFPQL